MANNTNKLVIRRLPPTLSEDDFLKQVSPLASHDYFSYFEANQALGAHAFSRAYINFIDSVDMVSFCRRFDNFVWTDKNGQQFASVVEQALWQKSPKSGPFYKPQAGAMSAPQPGSNQADQAKPVNSPAGAG